MRIGEIARRLGLSHRSIRHYEDEGLVIPGARTPGGFRLYSGRDVQKFLFIMSMRPLEFSLEEISRFLTAIDDALDPEAERHALGLTVLDEFAEMIEERWLALSQQVEIAGKFRSYLSREVASGQAASPAPAAHEAARNPDRAVSDTTSGPPRTPNAALRRE